MLTQNKAEVTNKTTKKFRTRTDEKRQEDKIETELKLGGVRNKAKAHIDFYITKQ